MLGWAQFVNGEMDPAEINLRGALSLDPYNPSILYRVGRVYEEKNELEAAQYIYSQVQLIDRSCLACAQRRLGQFVLLLSE